MRTASNARRFLQALATALLLPMALPLFAEDEKGGYRLLELDGYKVKWGEHTLGAGASISYAFADLQPGDLRGIRQLYGTAVNEGELAAMDTDNKPPEPQADIAGQPTSHAIN